MTESRKVAARDLGGGQGRSLFNRYRVPVLFIQMKRVSGDEWWWWLHNFMNVFNTTELRKMFKLHKMVNFTL